MIEPMNSSAWLAGRILMSQIFLISGVMKIVNWNDVAHHMAEQGMEPASFFLGAAAAVEILGGLAVLIGFQTRLAASMLCLFLIPTTLLFHDFWNYDGMAMQNQMQHFLKNLTIMGGLVTLVGSGAGRFSLDALFGPRETTSERTTSWVAVGNARTVKQTGGPF